jgi:ubiquinone/menaquinone biosynthesis C-methylase UbiE
VGGTDYREIYRHHAEAYDALVSAEDCDRHLAPALAGLAPLRGAHALDVGTGTGRVARLLLEAGARVLGVDPAPAMLAVARRRLASWPASRWQLACADARALPVRAGRVDVVVAGWALGHLRHWHADAWREAIGGALVELERVLRPGGRLVLIETLGTGAEEPRAPSPEQAEYYAWLEEAQGMRRVSIRTDYRFPDVEAAARATGFFFGPEFAARVRREGWARVPECTGLWWREGRR